VGTPVLARRSRRGGTGSGRRAGGIVRFAGGAGMSEALNILKALVLIPCRYHFGVKRLLDWHR